MDRARTCNRRARWMGWIVGATMMGGGAWLLIASVWSLGVPVEMWMEPGWEAVAFGMVFLVFVGLAIYCAGFAVFTGYRMFREPNGRNIRRACLVMAVVAWFGVASLASWMSSNGERMLVAVYFGQVAGMVIAGLVYWLGSRMLIRFGRVPEEMDDAWREKAAKTYMSLLALMVWTSGTLVGVSIIKSIITSERWDADDGLWWLAIIVPLALAAAVYYPGRLGLVAWDRRMAQKDIPLASAVPRDAPAGPVVPDYRPADADALPNGDDEPD